MLTQSGITSEWNKLETNHKNIQTAEFLGFRTSPDMCLWVEDKIFGDCSKNDKKKNDEIGWESTAKIPKTAGIECVNTQKCELHLGDDCSARAQSFNKP